VALVIRVMARRAAGMTMGFLASSICDSVRPSFVAPLIRLAAFQLVSFRWQITPSRRLIYSAFSPFFASREDPPPPPTAPCLTLTLALNFRDLSTQEIAPPPLFSSFLNALFAFLVA